MSKNNGVLSGIRLVAELYVNTDLLRLDWTSGASEGAPNPSQTAARPIVARRLAGSDESVAARRLCVAHPPPERCRR